MLTSGYTFNNYFTSQRNWDVVCGYRLADLPARLSFLYLRCNPSTAKPVNLIALARRYTIRLLPAFILAQQLISNIVGQRRNKPLITIRIDMCFHSAAKPHLCSPAGPRCWRSLIPSSFFSLLYLSFGVTEFHLRNGRHVPQLLSLQMTVIWSSFARSSFPSYSMATHIFSRARKSPRNQVF